MFTLVTYAGDYLRAVFSDSVQLYNRAQLTINLLRQRFHNIRPSNMNDSLLLMMLTVVIFMMSRRATHSKLRRVSLMSINQKTTNNNVKLDGHMDLVHNSQDNLTNMEGSFNNTYLEQQDPQKKI